MNAERKEVLTAIGRIWARVSIVVLLLVAFLMSIASLEASDPEAAAEVGDALAWTTIAGYNLSVLDPFLLGVVLWSLAPVGVLAVGLLRELEVIGA